jgi:hypothetical protein
VRIANWFLKRSRKECDGETGESTTLSDMKMF